ncbi:MAG: HAMP domain-containing histidine kinase [Labilithrix sp.]|nr:HAMP domain-containing histidine kinase [Labilithrix sp.]
MRRRLPFEITATLGYAIVALLLAAGMAHSIRLLSALAEEHVRQLRAKEHEVELAEQLRWNSELIASDGRAYLLSGDPALLARIETSLSRFDESARGLRDTTLRASELALVDDVEGAAARFQETQASLVAERPRVHDAGDLEQRFENELLPRSRELRDAVHRMVAGEEASFDEVYAQTSRERHRVEARLYGLLFLLVLGGGIVAWYFARILGRSYRQEQAAHRTARRAVGARDEVMGIVAHDLRNPLGAITMQAAQLRRTAEPEKARRQAAAIENIAMRMEYLIRSMLDVATLEAGRFAITRALCDPRDLLRETVEMFRALAESKHIHLEMSADEDCVELPVDRERILEVLANLVGNALRLTPLEGRVILSARRAGDAIMMSVADTGPGIAREHLPHVFDRFWKHDACGTKGTGLGLFIARSIVEAHGGRIWVESDAGAGAIFYFTLPITAPAETTEPPVEAVPARA